MSSPAKRVSRSGWWFIRRWIPPANCPGPFFSGKPAAGHVPSIRNGRSRNLAAPVGAPPRSNRPGSGGGFFKKSFPLCLFGKREKAGRTLEIFFRLDGNVSEAARRLHLHRNTLLYRLDRLNRRPVWMPADSRMGWRCTWPCC